MTPDMNAIAAVAESAARRAGAIQKEKYGGLLAVDARLADDLKLEADRLCEAAIVQTIRDSFPDHAILAEESGRAEGSEYIWYVDPLDGTVNFYYGIPYFCTTLACYRQTGAAAPADPSAMGEPVLGVTYAALTDELFVARIGQGAFLGGRPLRVREESALSESFIITSFGNNPKKVEFTRKVVLPLSLRIRKTRNMGAAALDLANVAAGRVSGYMEVGINPWDVAAGRALVEAADGLFTARVLPNRRLAVVASGKTIHSDLLAALDAGLGSVFNYFQLFANGLS